MEKSVLWSLRLGYNSSQANFIRSRGLDLFLRNSFKAPFNNNLPYFLLNSPKTINEIKKYRISLLNASPKDRQDLRREEVKKSVLLQQWWIDNMRNTDFPLREKMVCFWHNHFVASIKKVKLSYWIYQHHLTLQKHAFGNFKVLTKAMLKNNALLYYLDNQKNTKNKINENLSRELLELFTLGIGNYNEIDVKNGAKALAGLGLGDEVGKYKKNQQNNDLITYLGKTGNFDVDGIIDCIFEHPNISILITEKILKWFVYDSPNKELITYYGNYFKSVNFEIKPLLEKIFLEEFEKDNQGSKIKDPLLYILQLLNELNLTQIESSKIVNFIKNQGMDLFNQPNVKGWEGGKSWLTSQTYLQREKTADLLCFKGRLNAKPNINDHESNTSQNFEFKFLNNSFTNKEVIKELTDKLLFKVDENAQNDMESILKYDFDYTSQGAQNNILRLFNYIIKTPELQVL